MHRARSRVGDFGGGVGDFSGGVGGTAGKVVPLRGLKLLLLGAGVGGALRFSGLRRDDLGSCHCKSGHARHCA